MKMEWANIITCNAMQCYLREGHDEKGHTHHFLRETCMHIKWWEEIKEEEEEEEVMN